MMIAPIVAVIVTGILALSIEIVRPKITNNAIVTTSLIGLAVAAWFTVGQFSLPDSTTLVDAVVRDRFSLVMQLILIGACALSILFSESYLRAKKIPFGEFYPLMLWSTSGAMLMATSRNLLVLFVGLEILSIALYVLAGMSREESKSKESALKYFLLGAFASGFFLYGIAFFYGATGSLDLMALSNALMGNPEAKMLLLFGFALMFVGLSFKSAFVPFHQWTPDVYQGAPTNITAFMAVVSKVGAIAALFRVMQAGIPIREDWVPAMTAVAIATMLVGNAVALLQKDVKRILGYSSIGHAGYLLVGLLSYVNAPGEVSIATTLYYLMSYGFMTMGAFAVLSLTTQDGREGTRLEDLRGLWQRNPQAAVALIVFVVSLIGIPPTAGFFGKFFIFQDAVAAGLMPLAIVLAISSAISVAYYLAIAWNAFVAEDKEPRTFRAMSPAVGLTCAICLAGVILAGMFLTPITKWMTAPAPAESIVVTR